ncbi:bifunctional DNA primase/polymerase [Levilactobacillus yiduensis]|uniref:bifunctional DNA primase/polymerase n=1 Tax=Levilactobacillus yiduensis TaxID=2953880 RepID=UPI001FD6D419|nr:bifunctional DNA primase/polymerase [Levilactobacillus yiduensis]
MDRKTYALALAKQGFKLFPLIANTKKPPRGMDGYKSATSDLQAVSGWFEVEPATNIGLRLDTSNLLVVDVDRHTSGSDGVASLAELKRTGYELPTDTYIEKTPGSGLHLFLSVAGTNEHPQRKVNWRPGVDVLTDFVVIAPSVIGGRSYQPVGSQQLTQAVAAPDWLLSDLSKKKVNVSRGNATPTRKTWTGRWLDDLVQGTAAGNRNVFLTSLVGKIFNTGCQSATAYELLQVANDHLDTPLPSSEVNQIFKSVLKRL